MDRPKVAALILKQRSKDEEASQLLDEHRRAQEESREAQNELKSLLEGFFEKTSLLRFQTKGRCFVVTDSGSVTEQVFEEL